MLNEELTELYSFEGQLKSEDPLIVPSQKIKEFRDCGFESVTVKIFGSSKKAALKLGKEKELFENIKKVQSLPDNVVYDLLKCKGSLFDGNFYNRIVK